MAAESAGIRVVVVSSVDPRAAPYEADRDSLSAGGGSDTADAPSCDAAARAASQLDELARLSPQIRAVVQVHHIHESDIPTSPRSSGARYP